MHSLFGSLSIKLHITSWVSELTTGSPGKPDKQGSQKTLKAYIYIYIYILLLKMCHIHDSRLSRNPLEDLNHRKGIRHHCEVIWKISMTCHLS